MRIKEPIVPRNTRHEGIRTERLVRPEAIDTKDAAKQAATRRPVSEHAIHRLRSNKRAE